MGQQPSIGVMVRREFAHVHEQTKHLHKCMGKATKHLHTFMGKSDEKFVNKVESEQVAG